MIGAGAFAYNYSGTVKTTQAITTTAATTATGSTSCYPTDDLAASRHFGFSISINYTGPWNATAEGFSGGQNSSAALTPYFVDCFTGSGAGLIYLSDWNPGGQATLQFVAEKTDSDSGNLSMSLTFGTSNSLTETNSAALAYGTTTLTATMLGAAAVVRSAATSTSSGTQLYGVAFTQAGDCSPKIYVAPWSVTLGNQTIAQPSNATLPISGGAFAASSGYESLSTIIFSVPNGVYSYTLSPPGAFSLDSGSVTVNRFSVSVTVNGPVVSCTPTTG